MKLLISGATGLLGQEILRSLTDSGVYDIRCLARPTSNVALLGDAEIFYGDARYEDSLYRALSGVDTFLHIAGLEYTPQVLSAMHRARVGRLLLVGSTSVHSAYEHRSGWRRSMEELVRESGLDWTIVRPTMIYGSELDKNIHKLLRCLDRSPVFPMFGTGENLWQPVYYKDLALGVLAALEKSEAICRSYDLPGARPLEYQEIIHIAAEALGKEPLIVRLPIEPVRHALQLAERLNLRLPIESEQVLRLREDKAYLFEKARRELGYAPRTFPEGIALEVVRLRELGLVDS